MPAAMAAYGLVPELPARRTVEVLAVLLVVGVQDEQQVQRLGRDRVDLVVLAGTAKNMCSMLLQ
jgi:hypothetical protein